MKQNELRSPLVHVGASEVSINAARAAIMEILVSQNAERVKREALFALRVICEVKNVKIEHCNIGIMSGMGDAR